MRGEKYFPDNVCRPTTPRRHVWQKMLHLRIQNALFQFSILKHRFSQFFFKDKISKIMPKNFGEMHPQETILYLFLMGEGYTVCIQKLESKRT